MPAARGSGSLNIQVICAVQTWSFCRITTRQGATMPMSSDVRRRELLGLVCGAAVSCPVMGFAQQPDRVRRIGVLSALAEDDPENKVALSAFRQGCEKLGWSEGHNVRIDVRFAAGNANRFLSCPVMGFAQQP